MSVAFSRKRPLPRALDEFFIHARATQWVFGDRVCAPTREGAGSRGRVPADIKGLRVTSLDQPKSNDMEAGSSQGCCVLPNVSELVSRVSAGTRAGRTLADALARAWQPGIRRSGELPPAAAQHVSAVLVYGL